MTSALSHSTLLARQAPKIHTDRLHEVRWDRFGPADADWKEIEVPLGLRKGLPQPDPPLFPLNVVRFCSMDC